MKKNIKMIGLDLDGTLLTTEKKLSNYTRCVLEKAIEQGVVVLAATGRPLGGLPEEIRTFPGMRYAVTANGARILDLEKDEALYEQLISVETAGKVLDILEEYDTIQEVFIDGKGYTKADGLERVDEFFEEESMAEYMRKTRTPVDDVKAKLEELNRPADKVHGIFKDLEEKQEAEKRVSELPGLIATGAFRRNLEVNCEGVNKGIGLLKLGEMLGIRKEEIMACGDGMNDFEMLQTIGFAVAMENGCEELKEIADYVTCTNDEDGVAKAIERFVLK